MRVTKSAPFKYTFPITKAEKRSDGLYVIGYASGPEVDLEGERMDQEAITRFSDQINNSEPRLPYRDAHAPDGVLRDLGEITKGWINEHFHLGIEVKLDETNPASLYLFRQITEKGKQYGMSVAGAVEDYADEFVDDVGAVVRTYKNVVLDEISNTTRPAWYPSFGTVLSKSIKDASIDAPVGVNVENDELPDAAVEGATTPEAASADGTTEKSETTETGVEKTSASRDASSAAYIEASLLDLLGGEAGEADDEAPLRIALAAVQQFIAQETAEIGSEADIAATGDTYASWSESDKAAANEIAKAGRKLSGATSAKLLGLRDELNATLTELGVIEAESSTETTDSEKSASSTEEETVEKTDDSTTAIVEKSASELEALAQLAKANERIAELEALPRTQVPGVITDDTKKTVDEIQEALAKASPSEKMRLAFALSTQGR
jgi:hypothetical protein